jgi:hypothetical protein
MIDWDKFRSLFRASSYRCTYCNSRATYPLLNSKRDSLYCYDTYNGIEKLVCHCKTCKRDFQYPLNRSKRKVKKLRPEDHMYGGEVEVNKLNK